MLDKVGKILLTTLPVLIYFTTVEVFFFFRGGGGLSMWDFPSVSIKDLQEVA